MLAIEVIGSVMVVGGLWSLLHSYGTSRRLDRLRQVDPEMANRMEATRAEHSMRIRQQGQGGGGL